MTGGLTVPIRQGGTPTAGYIPFSSNKGAYETVCYRGIPLAHTRGYDAATLGDTPGVFYEQFLLLLEIQLV